MLTAVNNNDSFFVCLQSLPNFLENLLLQRLIVWREGSREGNLETRGADFFVDDIHRNTNIDWLSMIQHGVETPVDLGRSSLSVLQDSGCAGYLLGHLVVQPVCVNM